MKKYLFLFMILGLLFNSCTNDDDFSPQKTVDEETPSTKINVKSVDGYLKFASDADLKNFLSVLEEENGSLTKSVSSGLTNIEGFKSLSVLKKELQSSSKVKALSEDEDEEMTVDEYNVMTAENLLLDPVLTEVMDTTLRIGVGDRVFKITEYGTFSAPSNKASYIQKAIDTFDKNIKTRTVLGEYVELANEVTYTNSFGDETVGNELVQNMVEEETSLTKTVSSFENDFHNGYNVSTFNWKNNSVWQKFWDWVRGKDVSKEVKFDKKHRVQLNVYNVNYGFYASSGIKVKMQKRKKFIITYWVGTKADNIAVGFNKLYGEMKFTNPRHLSTITPTNGSSWNSFTGAINNLSHDFVYGQYKKFDLVKDWVDDIYMFTPEIEIKGNIFPNQSHVNKFYELPADQIYKFLKGQAGKMVYDPIKKQIQPKDPRVAYFAWGTATLTYDKDKSYIMGVQEYGRRESKSVRFDRSFGFTINNNKGVGGFVPSEFKIKDLDVFGAAYYNGQWKGVRFINK